MRKKIKLVLTLGAIFISSCLFIEQARAVETGWDSDSTDLTQFGLPDAAGTGDISFVIIGVMDWLLTIVGIVAIIAFIISGFQYFMVATDEKMIESAKKTMKAAVIGLIVALSGFVAIQAINSMLNADSIF